MAAPDPGLPSILTDPTSQDPYEIKLAVLGVKGRLGIGHLLDHWDDMSDTAKLKFFDAVERAEIVEHADAIIQMLLASQDSVVVLGSAARRLCSTNNAKFHAYLEQLQPRMDGQTAALIESFLKARLRQPAANAAQDGAAPRWSIQPRERPNPLTLILVVFGSLALIASVIIAEFAFLDAPAGYFAASITLVAWIISVVFIGSVFKVLPLELAERMLGIADRFTPKRKP